MNHLITSSYDCIISECSMSFMLKQWCGVPDPCACEDLYSNHVRDTKRNVIGGVGDDFGLRAML